jgi:multidrug efflux pump subunit AcrB
MAHHSDSEDQPHLLPSPDLTGQGFQHRKDMIGRFAQHKVAANLLMLFMMIAGAVSLTRLNTQFLPNFALDYITVRVVWPGAAPEDITRSITTPLENELRNLDYVNEMTSISTRGLSMIILEYNQGTDMGMALDQVKEKVGLVRNLPEDAQKPEITKIVRNEDVADLILTAPGNLNELRPLAYKFRQQLLDAGIAKVDFTGLPDQELAIQIPEKSIKTLNMSLPQMGQKIIAQSQDIPAGTSGKNETARELRSLQQRRTAAGFDKLAILTTASGQRLTLKDVGKVTKRAKPDQVEVFYKGQPAILMKIKRTENADTLKSASILHNWLDKTRPTLSPGVKLLSFDEAYVLIKQRIDLLLTNGLSGLILVVAILFIFLNGRVAFWVSWGIPVSFLGTLSVLYLVGGSINMVSLFALIMALGIIVDDAIVVGEDALTHYVTGESSLEAAEGGARRMFIPVLSSSLTTVAAFLPLMMVSGIIGNILSDIPLVIICVVIASLVECFLILPGHLRHSFHKNHHRKPSPMRLKMDNGFNHFRDHYFRKTVEWAMNHRGTTLAITFSLLVLALGQVASGRIPFTFFPSPDNTRIIGSVKFAAGTPPAEVENFAKVMEQKLYDVDHQLSPQLSFIKNSVVRINMATFDGGRHYSRGEQYASVQAELTSPDSRSIRNQQIVKAWEKAMALPQGAEQLSITSPKGGPPGKDIDIFLTGASPIQLKKAATQLETKLATFNGINNIQDDLPYGKRQYIFQLTPLGESLGLTARDIGRQLRAAYDGQILQVFYDKEQEVEVRIMLPDDERNYSHTLASFPVVTPTGKTVPLSNVASFHEQKGLELLRHTDGKLGIHVTAEVDTTQNNANRVLEALEADFLPKLAAEAGIQSRFKGQAKEQAQTGRDMKQGAIIALFLIYAILAWVFSSWVWPFAIMIAIPFGLTGAIFGHWLLHLDLTILSLFGFFGLSGIVVNDAIILVTFFKELRERGISIKQAVVDASCLRLRAVLLTSLTTIAGLTPLLFETSLQAQFLIPMAVSICFGLIFSTFLVLIVIPVILSLIEGAKMKFQKEVSYP